MILTGWYNGLFSILAFAFQMVLILVTGYARSNSLYFSGLLEFARSSVSNLNPWPMIAFLG